MLEGMPAAMKHRGLFLCAAVLAYGLTFVAFMVFEKPGLGIGHFYYLSVAMLAVGGGARVGIIAGMAATALYAVGIIFNPHIPPTEVPTTSTLIRLVTFVASGVLIGWFAEHNRKLVSELAVLAERDHLTGLPNTRAFEKAINERLEHAAPFTLLVGDMDALNSTNGDEGHMAGDDALRRLADKLRGLLEPDDDIARVGGDEFAILTSRAGGESAARIAARIERALDSQGTRITFGWAVAPQEGTNALALYRAADERLYARKLVRKSVADGGVVELPGSARAGA
jgi:diguanylate cyclase (GGDEF)-like protein